MKLNRALTSKHSLIAPQTYQGPYRRVLSTGGAGKEECLKISYGATNAFKVTLEQLIQMASQAQDENDLSKEVYESIRRSSPRGLRSTPGCGKSICSYLLRNCMI